MRAIGVTEFGGPEALHIVELPEPQAGPGEVRIRVRAAAVNPWTCWTSGRARRSRSAVRLARWAAMRSSWATPRACA